MFQLELLKIKSLSLSLLRAYGNQKRSWEFQLVLFRKFINPFVVGRDPWVHFRLNNFLVIILQRTSFKCHKRERLGLSLNFHFFIWSKIRALEKNFRLFITHDKVVCRILPPVKFWAISVFWSIFEKFKTYKKFVKSQKFSFETIFVTDDKKYIWRALEVVLGHRGQSVVILIIQLIVVLKLK